MNMPFVKKVNARLLCIASSFMVIFVLVNYFFTEVMLDKSMELTCDIYYKKISSNITREINLFKNITEKLATNEKIIKILDENRSLKDIDKDDKRAMTNEINICEGILESHNFIKTINIASLDGKYLYSRGIPYKNFDMTKRPWFKEECLSNTNMRTYISDIHIDYTTELDTISIISLIYSEDNELIGACIMDVFVKFILEYIDNSFYSGNLETQIIKNNKIYYSKYGKGEKDSESVASNDNYNIVDKNNCLGNGNCVSFNFRKTSIKNNAFMYNVKKSMFFNIIVIGLIISVALIISVKIAYRPAFKSIKKLKYLLINLDADQTSLKHQDEFRQLESISDSLGNIVDKKIKHHIYYDYLTDLPNRKKLELICSELIDNKEQFAIVFIDLNKFKKMNDIFGHLVGDKLLNKFGNIMKKALGDRGIIGRYSGDEFVIVYKDFADNEEFLNFYQNKILSKFRENIEITKDIKIPIEFSAGIAVYPRDGKSIYELIDKSDFMMYKNKKEANNQILFFNDEIYADMKYIEKIKDELTNVCERNELELYYQPIYDKNKNIKKAEALLRWNSKELGFISPIQFIEYAEENRAIVPIGYWVIEDTCKFIKDNNISIDISINVSPVQLMEVDFATKAIFIIDKYGINHNQICFEVTESVLLESNEIVLNNLNSLRKENIKLALDDFGTGYASFNYLRNHQLDILKIDKVFLDNASECDFEIINNIKNISRALDMRVVIEGVETEEQFEKLREMECDLFQGYYLARPMRRDDFILLIDGLNC